MAARRYREFACRAGAIAALALTAACGDDNAAGASCVEGSGAAPACTCDDGTASAQRCGDDGVWGACDCSEPAAPYRYVAVVSTTNDPVALADANPGPDVDAVMLQEEVDDLWATELVASAPGAWDPAFGNDNDAPDETTGPNNAIWDSSGRGPCNLRADEFGGQFHSLGGSGGFIVVRFADDVTLDVGETVHVWELSPDVCGNLYAGDDDRPDAYVVFLGREGAALDPPDFDDTDAWTLTGSSGNNGGIVSAVIR